MPALTTIHVARKPLDGTVAENAIKHGTGSLNIKETRVGYQNEADMRLETRGVHVGGAYEHPEGTAFKKEVNRVAPPDTGGRWPANVILQHLAGCERVGEREVTSGNGADTMTPTTHEGPAKFGYSPERHQFNYGKETVDHWDCADGCPVADVDEQSGVSKGTGGTISGQTAFGQNLGWNPHQNRPTPIVRQNDEGGASRFFKQVTTDEDLDMPALSTVHMARKPLEGTVAANALKYGTGSLNIGATRIGSSGGTKRVGQATTPTPQGWANMGGHDIASLPDGRWPANVILEHLPDCQCDGTRKVKGVKGGFTPGSTGAFGHNSTYGLAEGVEGDPAEGTGYTDAEGNEEIDHWVCAPGCPIADIDEQSGVTVAKKSMRGVGYSDSDVYGQGDGEFDTVRGFDDQGGASRYFKQSQYDLIEYLRAMISTPTHRAFVIDMETYPLWPGDQLLAKPGSVVGLVVRGAIEQERVDEFMRLLPPGGHVLLIAPDSQPTGHTGAILLEDGGFEIRDAILVVRGPGRAHYVAKAGRREREAGCGHLKGKAGHEAVERKEGSAGVDNPRAGAGRTAEHVKNFHPTVKPIAVMERLLADVPEGVTVLDPFLGSGTTGIACSKTGHSFIGIEREAEYLEIADARVRHWDRAHVGWQGADIESDHKVPEVEVEPMDLMDLFG